MSDKRRFQTSWNEVRNELSNSVREKVPDTDLEAKEGEQKFDQLGAEEEHITEINTENGPQAVNRDFTNQHLRNIASHPKAGETETISTKNNDTFAGVEIKTNGFNGFSEYDVGPEKEDVTDIVSSIGEAIENLDKVEQVTTETSPRRDVEFKRQGTLTEMMLRDSNGVFNWNNAEAGDFPGQEFITGKPRYFAFDDTYTGVMQVAGTGSIQVTMRPKIYEEHEGNPDKWVRDFEGGDRVGMHALSPLIYGPFQASPVINEKGEIETLNGRDKAYGQGFQTEWDVKGLGKTPEEYVTENSKAGYSPELSEIETIEDLQEFKADSEWTFSKPVEVSRMQVVDEGETYDPEQDYETLVEQVDFLDSSNAGIIRVGHEDWDLEDGRNTIKLNEFEKHQRLEGKIYLVDEDGNKESKRVVVDYQDDKTFGDMSEEEFSNAFSGHFQADATAVWEPFRMRPDSPAFEYRDMCNNPFRDAAIATQVGVYRTWKEIQEFAEDELGIYEDDAQELRLGVNDQGLDYVLNDEHGVTLQDAWMGTNGLDNSLYSIISKGVEEMSGENYSVEQYRDTMLGTEEQPGLIPNGLTPGEMMAKNHGVDIEGEILYDSTDLSV